MGGVWVTSESNRGGTISRINPSTNRMVWTATVGDDPCGIATGLGSVWAANSFKTADTADPPVNNKVFQVDPHTGAVRASIGVSPGAGGGPSCPPCAPGPGGIAVGSRSVWVITDWWNSKTKQTITRVNLTKK
jgi:DNA-binding beta-propeller fold protein YncE